jgi:PAS domain S-box-containing protein
VPATGADAWFGSAGGARKPPPEPGEQPQVADLLEQLVTSARRLLGIPDVLVYLVEHDEHGNQRLIVRRGAGCFATSMGRSLGKGEGLAGEVWRIGGPLAVGDYQSWPGRLRGERAEDAICGTLAVPLRSYGAVVGVLGVALRKLGRGFGEAEIELLCRLGELAGGAIDNAVRLAATRRELAELAQSEARYRTVFEELPALVYTEAYAIGGSWLYESPRVQDLVGYTPEESGQPGFWKKILHPGDRERVLAEDRRVELTGDPWRMEYRSIAKDGRVVWLRDHAVLVHGGPGEPSLWHGFVIDITEQKLAEQAMRQALEREQQATRQLRALDEAKNVFLTAVSHELRTPLAAIVGIALTLQRARSSLAEEDGADLVDRLAANAGKLDRLLSDLLDLDRDAQAAPHRPGRAGGPHRHRMAGNRAAAGAGRGACGRPGGPGQGRADRRKPAGQRCQAHPAGHAGLGQGRPPGPGRADRGRRRRQRGPAPAASGPVRAVPPRTGGPDACAGSRHRPHLGGPLR